MLSRIPRGRFLEVNGGGGDDRLARVGGELVHDRRGLRPVRRPRHLLIAGAPRNRRCIVAPIAGPWRQERGTPMQTRAAPRATDGLLDGERLRAASFIVTIYGDVVEPRGGLLWMGTLIEVCARAGISETRVRTAVSRLVAAGRLEGTREGRRSFYRLTAGGAAPSSPPRRPASSPRRPRPAPGSSRCSPPPRPRPRWCCAASRASVPASCSAPTPGERAGRRGSCCAPTGSTAAPTLRRLAGERWRLAGARGGLRRIPRPLRAAGGRHRPRPAARRRIEPAGAPAAGPRLPRDRARRPAAARRGAARTTGPSAAPAASSPTSTSGCRPPPIRTSPGASPASTGPLPAETDATQRRIAR